MAKRGDAKSRFEKSNHDNDQKSDRTWEIVNDSNQLKMIFIDPRESMPPQVIDITSWKAIGKTAALFAEAFARYYISKRRTTRSGSARSFRNGFVKFLVETGRKLDQPSDADQKLLRNFLAWLKAYKVTSRKSKTVDENKKSINKDSAQPAKPSTQLDLWKPCKAVFEEILRHSFGDQWKVEIPKNPFAGEKFIPAPKKNIDVDEYIEFLVDAARESTRIIDFVEPHLEVIERAVARIDDGGSYDPSKIDDVVAKVLVEHEGIVPERKQLQHDNPALFAEVSAHGYTNVCMLAHPNFGHLIPFLYLLAAHTGFNQQPLTYLDLKQISEPTIFGVTRMTLTPMKFRADSVVRRSFVASDEKLSVSSLIGFILNWTKRLRNAAPAFVADDLWLFANKWKSGKGGNFPIRSLAAREKNSQTELNNHLLRYCKARNRKYTGLKEIRLSFSELFLRANPGKLDELRILLGQKWISTTTNHYRTQQALADGQEQLAGAMLLHQRWISSGGKIDARSMSEKRERTAATPGYICVDPFDSPILGQKKGRLCEAYGWCPGCHLAAADPDIPYALARFYQLAQEYEEAKSRLGIEVWKRKYLDSCDALLNDWIPKLSMPAMVCEAKKRHLSRLPELE